LFEITTSWIGPLIIGVGIAIRRYILKKLDKEGVFANNLYIGIIILISLPFYIWHFNLALSSLDDKSAKKLVSKTLNAKIFDKYKLDILEWKPYNKEKDLYNIKASITDKNQNRYYMYLQPTCKFLKGCRVGLDKIMIINPDLQNIPIKDMNENMFSHRSCSDKIIGDITLQKNVEPFFKILFKKWNSIKNSQATYKIVELILKDFKSTKLSVKNVQDNQSKLSNSCQANLYIKGDFNINFKNQNETNNILSSMFDNVKQYNGYYKIRTKIDYNIYIDKSIGSVNSNALFIDLNKMKKTAKNIAAKMKNNISNSCKFDKKFSKDMIVYAAGAYNGKKMNIQIDNSGHQATKFNVIVNSPKKPVALMFSAYEPSIWNIKWTKGTKIEAVYVSGYYKQIVLGISNDTPLINSTYENKHRCKRFDISNKTIKSLNPVSRTIFNKNVKLVYLAKSDGKILLGNDISINTKLNYSKDRVLSNYIDKTRPLAGQAGLRDLAKKGFLRAYTKDDLLRWAKLQENIYKKNHNDISLPKVVNGSIYKSFKPSFVLHGYTILKKIAIPAGLYGGNAATFFLQKGVPFPEGKLGHSTLYDFNTGKCYGVLCGHI